MVLFFNVLYFFIQGESAHVLGGAGRPKKGNRVAKAVFSNLPWHQENSRHPTTQEQVESLHMAQLRKKNSFSPPVPRNLNGNMFIETSSNLFEKYSAVSKEHVQLE